LRPQGQNAMDHLAHVLVDRDESLGTKFTERDLQSPLIRPHRSQTIHCQTDTFADAEAGGTRE
jgi:hypothetical protein